MRCPRDGTEMLTARRAGVEIDWCPECRGVWLDRGELERICDRAAMMPGLAEPPAPPPWPASGLPNPRPTSEAEAGSDREAREAGEAGEAGGDDPDAVRARRHRRRRSFLDDIFDL